MLNKRSIRIEIELPIQIYGFLEACAKFSKVELTYRNLKDEEREEIIRKYVKDYIETIIVSSVKDDAQNISGTPLWTYQDLNGIYGLDEVEEDCLGCEGG